MSRWLVVLTLFGVFFSPREARSDEAAGRSASNVQGAGPPTSLTISGGISLGSYEAGMNWVLSEWLKDKQDPEHPNHPLVGVSGASAGAINALLTAIRWCEQSKQSSVEANMFGETWRNVGFKSMLPKEASHYAWPGNEHWQPDFLLSRMNAFEQVVRDLRMKLSASSSAQRARYIPKCTIDLSLMVSKGRPRRIKLEGIQTSTQRFVIPLTLTVTADDTLQFDLNTQLMRDGRRKNLMGEVLWLRPASPKSTEVDKEDVLLAVLASSAHPSSFSPIKLKYCALASDCPGQYRVRDDGGVCKGLGSGGFSLDGREEVVACSEPFVDGGAFDNVPLGVAMAQAESRLSRISGAVDSPPEPHLPVRYIYIDPATRRPASVQPECDENGKAMLSIKDTRNTAAIDPPARDPIGEILGFVRGMYASATDYELHNVLSYNDWNRTPEHALSVARRLSTRSFCPELNPDNWSKCAEVAARLAFSNSIKELDELSRSNKVREWVKKRKEFFDQLSVAMQVPLPRELAAAWASQKQMMDNADRDVAAGRSLQLPSRLAPVVGALLGHFGAFLDKPFRDYDYYAGIYDGLYSVTAWGCLGCKWAERRKMIEDLRLKMTLTDAAGAVVDEMLKLEGTLENSHPIPQCKNDPPSTDTPPEKSCRETAEQVQSLPPPPTTKVMTALLDPGRCDFKKGPCLADGNFPQFLEGLHNVCYEGEEPMAIAALSGSGGWWSGPTMTVADRFERLVERRRDDAKIVKRRPPFDDATLWISRGASLAAPALYHEANDPSYFAPWSDMRSWYARIPAISLGISTHSERQLQLGLLNYGLRWSQFALEADVGIRVGSLPPRTPLGSESGNSPGAFSKERRFESVDVMGGPAIRPAGYAISSAQFRFGRSMLAFENTVPNAYAFELALGFLLNHLRLSFGCHTTALHPDQSCIKSPCISVAVADLVALGYAYW